MPFDFASPVYLLLLPAVFVLYKIAGYSLTGFSKRQRQIHLLVRCCIFVLLVFALAGLTFHYQSSAKQFLVLIDKSKSIDEAAAASAEQFTTSFRQIAGKSAVFIPFAATPKTVKTINTGDDNWRTATDIQAAMEFALTVSHEGKVPHFVLLSDGNETGGSVMQFIQENKEIPISVIPLATSEKPEVAVSEVIVPQNIRQDEPFFVEIVIQSNTETEAEITLNNEDKNILTENKNIRKGRNVFRFQQTAEDVQALKYSVSIKPKDDTLSENNFAAGLSVSAPKPAILVIESEPAKIRDFAAALQEQGFDIELGTADILPKTLQEMDNYDGIIFSNVPAKQFSPEQLELLREYVEVLGGGFLMLGGENSFGLGGYHETPVEDILPAKCDIEDEDEKLPIAMCLVIDRSGSMGGEKMQLAKEAVKSAIDLLQKKDFIAIVAFDHASYLIAQLQSMENAQRIKAAVSTIEAAGGTNVYPALDDAYVQLLKANTKLKHIILLSDGYSVPGDYIKAVQKLTNAKITVSTVGVGDADNTLLQNIAQKGKGRHYVCVSPQSIPEIFAQETLAASKTSINEEMFLPAAAAPSNVLSGIDPDALPPLLGNIVLEAKPTAQIILVTETANPLLLRQRVGLGAAAVFTSDVKTKWGSEWLTWQEFPKFWSQVLRNIIRTPEQRPDERFFAMKQRTYAGKVYLTLDAIDESGQFINDGKATLAVIHPDGSSEETLWKQTAPGKYETEFSAETIGGYELQTVFQYKPHDEEDAEISVFRHKRSLSINYPDEFRMQETNTALLKDVAKSSGGFFEPTAEQIFRYDSKRKAKRNVPLAAFLISAAALLYVFDVLLKRMDVF